MRRLAVLVLVASAVTLSASSALAQMTQPGFGGPTRARQVPPAVQPAPAVAAERTQSWMRAVEAKLLALRPRVAPAARVAQRTGVK